MEIQRYKALNAELMEKIQSQKLELAEYRKNHIKLTAQLMEEHTKRLFEKKALRRRLEDLESQLRELVLYEFSAEQESDCETVSCRRRSSELRRSSCLASLAPTISPPPPTRRRILSTASNDDAQAQTAININSIPANDDMVLCSPVDKKSLELSGDLDLSLEDVNASEQHQQNQLCTRSVSLSTGSARSNIFAIIEEESDDETICSSRVLSSDESLISIQTEPRQREGNSSNTLVAPTHASPLCEVTNISSVATATPGAKINNRRRNRKSGSQSVENHNMSVQPVRDCRHLSTSSCAQLPLPSESHEISPRRTDFSNAHLVGSTPYSNRSAPYQSEEKHQSQTRTKKRVKSVSNIENSSEQNSSCRPSRHCRPTSLKEPPLNSKMRR